jgi:hypothetical protein
MSLVSTADAPKPTAVVTGIIDAAGMRLERRSIPATVCIGTWKFEI